MTTKFTFSNFTLENLTGIVNLQEGEIDDYEWTQVENIPLTDREQQRLQYIKSDLINSDTHLMNEATLWARGIYPILLLAEQRNIQAWSQVSLQAQYTRFELEGIVDGVLGKNVAGRLESPYVVVVEAKRGVESQNPVFQLYAQLLASAFLNWKKNGHYSQEIFGCYTIADSWKFMRAQVEGFEADTPLLQVEYSRELGEKYEAEKIFKILKNIVSKHVATP